MTAGEEEPEPTGPAGPDPSSSPSPPPPSPFGGLRIVRWWRRVPRQAKWALSVVVLIFVFEYLVLPQLANARKSLNLLGKVNIVGLIVACLLEALSLMAYAELTRTVLYPDNPPRSTILRINMASLAVSHIVPGGTAPGTAVSYRLFIDTGTKSSAAAFALASQGVGSAVVLNCLFWFALLISIPLNGYNPLYGFAGLAGVILFALFAGVVILLTRGKQQAADRLSRVARHLPFLNPTALAALLQRVADRLQALRADRSLLVHALEWASANWLLDAASLWVFLASFGRVISPIDLLVAYGLVNILAAIPVTPGGLGVVEGVLIPTLVGFHTTKSVATLAVLSWRLVNFWLPIPAGGASYLSLRFGHGRRHVRRQHA